MKRHFVRSAAWWSAATRVKQLFPRPTAALKDHTVGVLLAELRLDLLDFEFLISEVDVVHYALQFALVTWQSPQF